MAGCQALTKAGKPCRNTGVLETGFCIAHSPREVIASRGFGGPQPGSGRPRRPREIELIQEVAEERKAELRAVYTDGLIATRAVVVGNGPTAHVEITPDYPHRHKVAESIIDRLHGKPVGVGEQPTPGVTVNIALITDHELRADAADIRRRLAVDRSVKPSWPDAGD